MSMRTITLEFDEKFFALLEEHVANDGSTSVEDYVVDLVASIIFYKYETFYVANNYTEFKDDEEFMDFDDGFPF